MEGCTWGSFHATQSKAVETLKDAMGLSAARELPLLTPRQAAQPRTVRFEGGYKQIVAKRRNHLGFGRCGGALQTPWRSSPLTFKLLWGLMTSAPAFLPQPVDQHYIAPLAITTLKELGRRTFGVVLLVRSPNGQLAALKKNT